MNVYIADTYNHMIRKVDVSTSIITALAGTGSEGFSGDGGAATSAVLNQPTHVSIDTRNGDLYVSDYSNNRIRKITVSTGIISTVVGGSVYG